MNNDTTRLNLDLVQVLRVVRRRAPLVLLCLLLTAAAAFLVSESQHKTYTAASSVLFRNTQLDQQAAGLPAVGYVDPKPQTDTNLRLASLPRIATATANAVGHGLTAAGVRAAVTVGQESDTNLASITAVAASPSLAATIATTYARQVIADRQRTNRGQYSSALRAVNLQYQALTPARQRGAQGTDLKDRATSLQILGQLQGSDVQLAAQASAPSSPSSPKVARNTALAAILGLLLGIALAFLVERFDRRLREPGDLAAVYEVPLLGVVPESSALKREADETDGAVSLPPREAELFSLLRAHVRYFNVDQELRLVLVVSAAPGDGKTTIARNLTVAAATAGDRVLFIEADLRRPTAATHFGVQGVTGIFGSSGLVDVLTGGASLEDAVQTVEFAARGEQKLALDLLVAGGVLPSNPAQTLESQAMQALLAQAKSSYDFVVVDTPPLVLLSDAFPLLRAADGVLIVSRLGRNRRDVAIRLRDTLASAEASVIGVVANGYRHGASSSYGYKYAEYMKSLPAREYAASESSNGANSGQRAAPVAPLGSELPEAPEETMLHEPQGAPKGGVLQWPPAKGAGRASAPPKPRRKRRRK